jgi:hypothetical protein
MELRSFDTANKLLRNHEFVLLVPIAAGQVISRLNLTDGITGRFYATAGLQVDVHGIFFEPWFTRI